MATREKEKEGEPALDRPNTPRLRKQVRFREGQRCANPCCGKLAVHAHHMKFYSDGGLTVACNELACCPTCHVLFHLGKLKVSGVPGVNLRWERRVKGMDLELRAEREELRSIPVVAVQVGGGRPSGIPDGARVPSGIPDRDLAVQALRNLRYTKGEAENRVAAAGAALEREGQPVKLEELIRRALRGR